MVKSVIDINSRIQINFWAVKHTEKLSVSW